MDEQNPAVPPITVFYSYALEDELLAQRLENHLSNLRRQGLIKTWYRRQIAAGADKESINAAHFNAASIILLLVSSSFLASDYCYSNEMQAALQRHAAGTARVIPVLLRPVDWENAPFAHLRCLPPNEKPVTRWPNQDEAFRVISIGIREAIQNLSHLSETAQILSRTSIVIPSFETTDVRELLEAMGYRITDVQASGTDLYFLCDIKGGVTISQEVVHFIGREPGTGDITRLDDDVANYNAARGILLTRQSVPVTLHELILQRKQIQSYTLDEFTDLLADFRPYLRRMIEKHKASSIPEFYVKLAAESDSNQAQASQIFESLEAFVDQWLTEPSHNHLSILGDFGNGKTWFCKHYAYLAAEQYLFNPRQNRIPLLITLRDYSRAYNLEQLITDVVVNHFKIALPAGYDTFARLNEAGRLLLIFDGFDEMERRIGDYRIAFDNFWELTKVVRRASKVLLTCRTGYFLHLGEEKETLILGRNTTSERANTRPLELQDHQRFELVHLLDFNDEGIRQTLRKRLPSEWEKAYLKIQSSPNLRDLARRPVLLDMIIKTLSQIEEEGPIDQAMLYERYANSLLEQRWDKDSDSIAPKDRLFLVQELAWEMQQEQKLTAPSMPFSAFPEWVAKHLKDVPAEHIPFFARDMRAQSYLVRDDEGNYRFSHKSFLDYFVARKMASAVSTPNFDRVKAIEIWKTRPLAPETRDFLVHMVTDPTVLWQLIGATRDRSINDVGYAGGNAATVLGLQGRSFVRAKLAHTVLIGADLHNVDLTEADMRKTQSRQANMRNCILQQTDLREADLTQIQIGEMGSVEAVMFDQSGEHVISGSTDGIVRIWEWKTGNQVRQLLTGADITSLYSDDTSILTAEGPNGHIKKWDREKYKLVGTLIGHTGPVWSMSPCPTKPYFASCAHDGSIRIWNVDSLKQMSVIYRQNRGIWSLCYSPDGTYIAAAGGPKLDIYEVRTGKVVWMAPEETMEFRAVKYSNSNLLAYTTREGNIVIRDAESKRLISKIKGILVGPNSIAFSPEGQMLAISSSGPDVRIQIWNVLTGSLLKDMYANSSGYVGTTHWGIGQQLVSGSSDGVIRIWDVDLNSSTFGHCIKTLEVRTNCLKTRIDGARGLDAPAPDGRGTLHNWFIARGATEWPPKLSRFVSL